MGLISTGSFGGIFYESQSKTLFMSCYGGSYNFRLLCSERGWVLSSGIRRMWHVGPLEVLRRRLNLGSLRRGTQNFRLMLEKQ